MSGTSTGTDWLAASPSLGSRRRVIAWDDPMPSAALAAATPGEEYLDGIAQGRVPLPPIAHHFDMRYLEVGKGAVALTAIPDESHYNPVGGVHGGFAATLLDTAMAGAVHSSLPAGVLGTSLELKVSYLRAMTRDTGEVIARGRVTKVGSRVAFAEGDLRDQGGRLLATASSTLLVMSTVTDRTDGP